jgi:hypothetical protein
MAIFVQSFRLHYKNNPMKTFFAIGLALFAQIIYAQQDSLPPDTLLVAKSSQFICGKATVELPDVFVKNAQSSPDWQIALVETKKIKLKIIDANNREVYALDLIPNYLPTDINSQQQQAKWYDTGLARVVDLKSGKYFYLLEIRDFERKFCSKTGKLEIKIE